jgi:RNA polymerase sigma factor (sigma-70 family)
VSADAEGLLRRLAPQVLGVLLRRHGRFDACEDAVQEALLAASLQWPREGVPENAYGWLITVASRRLMDELRAESARVRREETAFAAQAPPGEAAGRDDTLTLLFLCCHPALSGASQVALTLRAVGGLTTGEIAQAFLAPEATMAQRISRAKATLKQSDIPFAAPAPEERDERLRAVLQVLYLIFNEGYTATSGPELQRADLTAEAIRLTRTVHALLPRDREITALLALMLLTDARRPARSRPDGSLVPLAEQDRSQWDAAAIREGIALISGALADGPLGPYRLQAAIAAVHAEAQSAEDTDWREILALYELLEAIAPNPMVTLNRAVALGMARGPRAGLALIAKLDADGRVAGHHRLHAVRAHLLEQAGDAEAAEVAYREAARRTTSLPERRYLEARAARISPSSRSPR